MKKWIIGASFLILVFLISSYLFIPEKIIITKSVNASVNPAAVIRFLASDSNWIKWWPGSIVNPGGVPELEAGGYQFKKTKELYQSFEIQIVKGELVQHSLVVLIPSGLDSVGIKWTTTINTGDTPFSRIRHYRDAEEIGRQMENILAALQNYVSSVQHMYGLNIRKDKVKVEFLVTAKKLFNTYPATENIYGLIGQIKNYISRSNATEEDFPMMHVRTTDSIHFELQVAIPVDRQLPGTELFVIKKMLKGGDILVSEVTGTKSAADSAMKQMEQYLLDHKYKGIAIPFQSLVTDRVNEPDSSKWVTKIYFPIL